ncbi:MAG: hypothetical protein WBD75_06130 [Phycisphaerae bacterium]
MPISQCPGQDKRFWKPDDIFESPCPECGAAIEFWKDNVRRRCRGCGATVANPRFDMGCAAWCRFAEQCLGAAAVGLDGLVDLRNEGLESFFGMERVDGGTDAVGNDGLVFGEAEVNEPLAVLASPPAVGLDERPVVADASDGRGERHGPDADAAGGAGGPRARNDSGCPQE